MLTSEMERIYLADWWVVIFGSTDSPFDSRELGLTCKWMLEHLTKARPKLANQYHLRRLLRLYPDAPWDMSYLSENPGVTLDMIKTIPLDWDYKRLSDNPNLTWEFVQEHPDAEWSWQALSRNRCITWDIIKANPTKPWCPRQVSRNPNITWEIIKANPDYPWVTDFLDANPNITPQIVVNNPEYPWRLEYECPLIIRIMKTDPEHRNHDSWEMTAKMLDKYTYGGVLEAFSSLNIEYILSRSDITWDQCALSQHPGLTIEHVKDGSDRWSWFHVSTNRNFGWSDILANPGLPWVWIGVCCNPNVTWEIVRDNPQLPWDWGGLSKNRFGL